MLLAHHSLTSAAVAVVAVVVAAVVLRCRPPGRSRENWSRRWWLRHPRQFSRYWPSSISYSPHTHPKSKVTNKQTSNILGFYAKRRKLGLGWSLTILASSAPHYIPWPTFPLLSQLPDISVPSPGRVRVPSQLFRRADVTSSFTSYLGKSARKKSHLWRTSLLSSFIPPCHWLWTAHPFGHLCYASRSSVA